VREKVVAAAADRFIVIVDATKIVDAIGPPVPLELLRYGLAATLSALAPTVVRPGAAASPDGNVIADFQGEVDDPAALAARLDATPGVVGHGLFAPALTSEVLIAASGGVQRRVI
jgi:ribose 5-phosphate isomerase A